MDSDLRAARRHPAAIRAAIASNRGHLNALTELASRLSAINVVPTLWDGETMRRICTPNIPSNLLAQINVVSTTIRELEIELFNTDDPLEPINRPPES
jgi:hypothetical protein